MIEPGQVLTFKSILHFCAWMDENEYEIMRWNEQGVTLRKRVEGNLFVRVELARNDKK